MWKSDQQEVGKVSVGSGTNSFEKGFGMRNGDKGQGGGEGGMGRPEPENDIM